MKIFDEKQLRQEITKQWDEYGAHIEVFDKLIRELETYKKKKKSIWLGLNK